MTKFVMFKGNFYTTKGGRIVYITTEIPKSDRMYRKGYRFVDHRGVAYTEEGSADRLVMRDEDIVEQTTGLTAEQSVTIINEQRDHIRSSGRKAQRLATFDHAVRRALPVLSGVDIGLGIACIMSNAPRMGAVGVMTGIFGIIYSEKLNQEG